MCVVAQLGLHTEAIAMRGGDNPIVNAEIAAAIKAKTATSITTSIADPSIRSGGLRPAWTQSEDPGSMVAVMLQDGHGANKTGTRPPVRPSVRPKNKRFCFVKNHSKLISLCFWLQKFNTRTLKIN